jgi:hypothetical protein
MRKILPFLACCSLVLFFSVACTAKQPYQQYLRAYQQLWKSDSFVVERNSSLIVSDNIQGVREEDSLSTEETYWLTRDAAGEMFIANIYAVADMPVKVNQYYRNGQLFSQNMTRPEENYRCRRTDAFARAITLEGIIDFPKDVIARQGAEDNAEGRLLTFEMDSKKYYEYRFPPASNDGYRYGEFSSFREPPLYTVLLDQQGRIIRFTGNFCTVNSDSTSFTWDQSYSIIISQYGEVEVDFPELNEEDYPELYQEPSAK